MIYYFGNSSRARLIGVHSDLVLVAGYAITICPVDFSIVDGKRTIEKQREYVDAGTSWTMDSRHLTGHAIDVEPWIPGSSVWKLSEAEQWKLFREIAKSMKIASKELHIPILWGGDWRKKKDGPHFYLSRRLYPKGGLAIAS
jgi:peptidoglycan L-alanyl-D-glutamate endopeptidase CwlK